METPKEFCDEPSNIKCCWVSF